VLTDLGGVGLGGAAADDVTAWCLLALVVGAAQVSPRPAWAPRPGVIGGAIVFIALMFLAVRPLLGRVPASGKTQSGALPPLAISGTFLAVLLAALTTEAIGIHAVFGAFFAYTGMRTQINLVNGWESWLWCAAIILAATIGKFGGTLVAARLTGVELGRGGRARNTDEYPRAHGTDRPEHRPRPRSHQPDAVRDDGRDGPGDHGRNGPVLQWLIPTTSTEGRQPVFDPCSP
jgi:Kef-type K+ transport system membrane component KefB